ncbi:divergent AAA domain protein [Bacteriovorax sp. BAL6_X]|uniref:ATP-binding protein n=1 Tax=Bacteriovorax sp. BAL6_X TaxID=1201290 RepID=UPI000385B61C|nr:ATP-binding protein [Bacteriovorax sp. BAL6_X]EPZ52541.1 divergent AAA domain protein [Bacteriovorax sp. BAL6_X]
MEKIWIDRGLRLIERSLDPPHELNELDWKTALSEDKKKLAEHLSAFANQAGGGFLIFGINDSGTKVGIANNESKEIINRLGNIGHDSLEPAVKIDHYLYNEDGKNILMVYIEESKSKPVHLRGKGIEHSFIRTACSTRRMNKVQLAQALMSSKIEKYEELDSFISSSIEEVLSLLEYGDFFELLDIPVPSSTEKIARELEKRKLIRFVGDQVAITNLGVLLAAKDFSKFSGFERRGVRVILYSDKTRTNAEREVVGKKGYAIGFKGMLDYIMQNLPSSEVIKDAIRQEVKVYPKVAIREIMANALIHQDLHNISINPKVEIFTDRIEISNPGSLMPNLSLDRIIDNAEPRNEVLARAMYHLGICEDRGSGIDRALDAIELFNLPPLKFEELPSTFKVTIYSPKEYQDMSPDERVRACYQHCVLKYLANEKMTNQTFRKRLKVAKTNHSLVSKIIKQTVDEGKIKVGDPSSKSTKFTYYVPSWA